ncbi:hypothetical protein HOO69_06225 [Vibrio europaeus]|uniref:Uncharacterized protein n=1 Tax=Vibrio europaeus TaxID=300876 RepID=A0AAE7DX78_9VIBR|nr:hypothetical protein HOO69_06225 [Vibrio europaeus]
MVSGATRLVLSKAHNKLLKMDYQRSAILDLVWYSVYSGWFKCRVYVASHLAGRYVYTQIPSFQR